MLDDRGDETDAKGVLPGLIEVEQRVLAAIRDAEAAAERRIAEARAELESRASAHDAEVDVAVRALRQRLDEERSAALAEIERRSREAARRHLEVSEARVRELGALLARRVAEGDLDDPAAGHDERPASGRERA